MRRKHALLVLVPLVLIPYTAAEAANGSGSFSPNINWKNSPNLYYNVNGGPPNTCGDLNVSRNGGAYTVTHCWLFTDGSGNASKGPWTWANQNGDESAYGYISWPDNTSTNLAHHIWDKTPASITINPLGSTPPTSFSGSASKGANTAGFKADFGTDAGVVYPNGSKCYVQFRDTNTNLYWCPGSGSNYYTNTINCNASCTIYGMTSYAVYSVTWSADQVPPGYAYDSMHSYEWKVIIYDDYSAPPSPILGQRVEKSASF